MDSKRLHDAVDRVADAFRGYRDGTTTALEVDAEIEDLQRAVGGEPRKPAEPPRPDLSHIALPDGYEWGWDEDGPVVKKGRNYVASCEVGAHSIYTDDPAILPAYTEALDLWACVQADHRGESMAPEGYTEHRAEHDAAGVYLRHPSLPEDRVAARVWRGHIAEGPQERTLYNRHHNNPAVRTWARQRQAHARWVAAGSKLGGEDG